MDEVGCSVFHSDEPNVCLQPFLYQPDEGESISYSLMWPIKDISAG